MNVFGEYKAFDVLSTLWIKDKRQIEDNFWHTHTKIKIKEIDVIVEQE